MRSFNVSNKLIIAMMVVFLGACATDGPVISTVIQKVEIPIAIPCKAEVPTKPDFSFDKATAEQDIFEKSKALLADRKLHLGYEEELLVALNSCIK
jgi:hypothetical protein